MHPVDALFWWVGAVICIGGGIALTLLMAALVVAGVLNRLFSSALLFEVAMKAAKQGHKFKSYREAKE